MTHTQQYEAICKFTPQNFLPRLIIIFLNLSLAYILLNTQKLKDERQTHFLAKELNYNHKLSYCDKIIRNNNHRADNNFMLCIIFCCFSIYVQAVPCEQRSLMILYFHHEDIKGKCEVKKKLFLLAMCLYTHSR